jgi:hypothetical protein
MGIVSAALRLANDAKPDLEEFDVTARVEKSGSDHDYPPIKVGNQRGQARFN